MEPEGQLARERKERIDWYSARYRQCHTIADGECFIGAKNCGTCTHRTVLPDGNQNCFYFCRAAELRKN